MLLRHIRIAGYKSIVDLDLDITEDNFLVMIGENNQGKSNILRAIELFFLHPKSVDSSIFFHWLNGSNSIETVEEVIIELTFKLEYNETQDLSDWVIDGNIVLTRRYYYEGNKIRNEYKVNRPVLADEWLRPNYQSYNNLEVINRLPIHKYLPLDRITKKEYEQAVELFLIDHPERHQYTTISETVNQTLNKLIERYIPDFFYIPAVKDIEEELKTTGNSILSKIMDIKLQRVISSDSLYQNLVASFDQFWEHVQKITDDKGIAEINKLEGNIDEELAKWNVKSHIQFSKPELLQIIRNGSSIILDDGVPTEIAEKGHGLQRATLFALIKILEKETSMDIKGQTELAQYQRNAIFAFEEPEIYLHPQMCDATYDMLKKLTKKYQVLLCTHSAHFVDISDYRNIAIVKKTNNLTGSEVHRMTRCIFPDNDKKWFDTVRFFNPDRSEVFFAQKVVLVEGPTEKTVFPLVASRLSIYNPAISIIDCEGKQNIPKFMDVLNSFHIPYLVIYDKDHGDQESNALIEDNCNRAFAKAMGFPTNIEEFFGIPNGRSKPYTAFRFYSDPNTIINGYMESLVREIYQTD